METKNDVMAEICNLINVEGYSTSAGSSIPRRFFSELLDHFSLPDEGDSVNAAKALLKSAGINWFSDFDSSNSPSGGGGTVTLSGLKAIRQAVVIMLDENEVELSQHRPSNLDPAKADDWTLLKGQSILRKLLHDRYGGTRQGGIAPSARTKNIFLFTDEHSNNEHGYESDHWIDERTFIYCGGGQSGNQTLTRFNHAIINHKQDGKKLRLFSPASGRTTYLGEFEIDSNSPYQWVEGYGRDGILREVVMFKLNLLSAEIRHGGEIINDNSSQNLFGVPYIAANESERNLEAADPWAADPNLLDKALQIHSITQNYLAKWVQENYLIPLSPSTNSCDFDIAWESQVGKVVCEVKSITDENEKHQFRLGLGQVLEYAHSINALPVLVFSRKPKYPNLEEIAETAGVGVLWPEILALNNPDNLTKIITN